MSPTTPEPIAIIGTGCRFPGRSNNPSRLWDLLKEPRDLLSKIPSDRFSAEGFYNKDSSYHGSSNVRHSYFLDENVRQFDAQFFGIKPIEANATDPQQRLLLETVYEAIDSAGLKMADLHGSDTAVYAGIMCGDYESISLRETDSLATYHATGIAKSIVSNRISYTFGLTGPSMTIDTACSSSLIAVHQAVQVLRQGDANMAIATGTNLILGPENYISESSLKMLSPTGRSRMWDDKADGYARGEAVAAVVLKRLSAAIADGDHVECVIRESGTNQDGRTRGITMPSQTAQANLIRKVYRKAGLDPRDPAQRCQFFECHGTGTLAGDPVEAEAISDAFFGIGNGNDDGSENNRSISDSPLYVGSIKTVVGHTEGTAGLAGIIKASLALQNKTIPPNMLFDSLNTNIERFYGNLQITTAAIPWPDVAPGQPRRASVNSFGFGGANAHVILESYEGNENAVNGVADAKTGVTVVPFVFSAGSQRSMKNILRNYSSYLKENKDTSLSNLAWTLHSRKTLLGLRASFAATDMDQLITKLDAASESPKDVGTHGSPVKRQPKILGVFTGQGAQWAGMGKELIKSSEFALARLTALEMSLQQLPAEDRPSWSLVKTVLEAGDVMEAALSQPICTAIQIILVDLLRAAGVSFSAVVGHSSGEIAAAYAAGYLGAEDAYRVAYYRGMHASMASGINGQPGKMMAVATSRSDAQDLCRLRYFRGRLCVAANNAANSVTLSGDADAIAQAHLVFGDEGKMAKVLFVDKAYHSHHMQRCAATYEKSLSSFNPKLQRSADSQNTTRWFSSVYNEDVDNISDKLDSTYWNANMVGQVLFADALETANTECGPFDAAVEVGPHPALKTPSLATIKGAGSQAPATPYTGILKRGGNDVEAFSAGLGSLWAALGDNAVNMEAYENLFNSPHPRDLIKGLPVYPWDNEQEYWHESRASRAFRTRSEPTHQLLGNMLPDGTADKEYRWRNLISVKEVPWLDGHKLQGQTVMPAAGYVSMAFEASTVLVPSGRSVKLLEVEDVSIESALVFQEDDVAVETLFTLTNIQKASSSDSPIGMVVAHFALYATVGKQSDTLVPKANGTLKVTLGEPTPNLLPSRPEPEPLLIKVGSEHFYSALADIGYGYSGKFQALDNISRRAGYASGTISNRIEPDETRPFLIHPATLDTAIQAVILAYCYPNDNQLWGIHVPTRIRSVRVDPALCAEHLSKSGEFPFDSTQTAGAQKTILIGDVDLYTAVSEQMLVQLQGVECVPFAAASAANDTLIFSSTEWQTAQPDGPAVCWDGQATDEENDLARDVERICLYYLNSWDREFPEKPKDDSCKGLLRYSEHVRSQAAAGKHRHAKKEWMNDTAEGIRVLREKHAHSLDVQMLEAVGQNIPAVWRGETTILEHLLKDNLLGRYYKDALAFPPYTKYLARMAAQLTYRYPAMSILEIGAGTGHATRKIFEQIGNSYKSYHFTDISSGFFENAQADFKDHVDSMAFQVLDIEKDVASQGFQAGTFDLIVASFVLHATSNLETTLRNVRALLKPGGYLLLLEVTNNEPVRPGFIFGSLPGWWVGEAEGRLLSPCVEPMEWDALLQQTGFSGIDTITRDEDRLAFPASVIVSQAIDNRISLLREPMMELRSLGLSHETVGNELVIIGGASLRTSTIVRRIASLVGSLYTSVITRRGFAEIGAQDIISTTTVLSLADIDKPVFDGLTESSFSGVKAIFESAKTIVWFTEGCRADSPYANMSIGFGRTMLWEMPGLQLQFIDIATDLGIGKFGVDAIVDALVRYELANKWNNQGTLSEALYSIEPELSYTVDGTMIPRVLANTEQNNRYNASRRQISEAVDVSEFAVSSLYEKSRLSLVKGSSTEDLSKSASPAAIRVKVQYSSASCVPVGSTGSRLFVVYGKDEATGKDVIALSETSASTVIVPQTMVLPVSSGDESESNLVQSVVDGLISAHLLRNTCAGDLLLLHEPTRSLASVVAKQAADKNVKVVVTTTQEVDIPSRICLQANISKRSLVAKLPVSVNKFVDLSLNEDSRKLASDIRKCLPSYCSQVAVEEVFTTYAYTARGATETGFHDELASASTVDDSVVPTPAVSISAIADFDQSQQPAAILDWKSTSQLSTKIRPIEESIRFNPTRTYWLVGLTGDLGLSLCEWMIRLGARHVVLTSRNPKIDANWLEKVAGMGATVKVMSSDVTNMQSVQTCYDEICSTLPPIAGVAQGAMVLRDTSIHDMDFDTMATVLGPKVQGSINLEQLFHSTDLEFFVYFSSMTGVLGNMGQSNYTAANAYMMSLSAQRRSRGLASSVINIGVVIGVGYVTREVNKSGQENLQKGGYMFLSEQMFHQVFAEAVLAGRPGVGREAEISTGLRHIRSTDENQPIWYDNPKFSHHVLTASAAESGAGVGEAEAVPMKTQLQQATSQEQVFNIVKDGFLLKLENLLKVHPGQGRSDEAVLSLHMDELGVDSLIAVEIRTWFVKSLQANVPVLKILGGASVGEILNHALSQMTRDMTPGLDGAKANEAAPPSDLPKTPAAPTTSHSSSNSQSSDLSSGAHTPPETVITAISSPEPAQNIDKPAQSIEKAAATAVDEPRVQEPLTILRSGPLSHGQSMFWFVHIFTQDPTTLNHSGSFRLRGNVRVADLKRAVDQVAAQHESLRTCFYKEQDGVPVQGIMESAVLSLETYQVQNESEVQKKFGELRAHVYNLERGETMRLILLTKSRTENYLFIGCHHINVDGHSHQVLMRDLEKAYRGETLGKPLQFFDYALRQREEVLNGMFSKPIRYWKRIFPDVPAPLPIFPLPDAKARVELTRYDFYEINVRLSPELSLAVTQQSRKLKATPFQFYLAAFRALVVRFTGVQDFCVGIGDASRTGYDTLESIGPFVNLLSLRFTKNSETQTFDQMLSSTRQTVLDALTNSRVPFSVLLDELNVKRSQYHSPLFQAFVDYREGAKEKTMFGDLEMEMMELKIGRTAYDVNLDIVDSPTGCMLKFMGQASLYSRDNVQHIVDGYVNLLESFTQDGKFVLSEASVYSDRHIQTALNLGQGPIMESQWPETLIHRVTDMVKQHAKQDALKDGTGECITYEQMFARILGIAAPLPSKKDVTGDYRVAVFQERGSGWVCSLLAAMYVGATYVPLDSSVPVERLSSIVSDCQPNIILVDDSTADRVEAVLAGATPSVINITKPHPPGTSIPPIEATADSPGAIFYTSGSTGTPKGIPISHSSLRDEVEFSAVSYGFGIERVLNQSSPSFDMSVTQIFGALAFGGFLYVCDSSMHADPVSITKRMATERITMTGGTPSEYLSWINNGADSLSSCPWKVAVSGGEPVSENLLRAFRLLNKPDLRLFNSYGPTEVTCSSNRLEVPYRNVSMASQITAGKTAPNAYMYIADHNMQPVPVGFSGEIVVGGAGIAQGYLNRPEETSSRFFENSTLGAEYVSRGWSKLHRTGDQGRLLPGGQLLIQGRIAGDTQFKLRGIRIDMRDIEQAILKTADGSVSEAIVTSRSSDGIHPDFLVAHLVLAGSTTETQDFTSLLLAKLPLPQHMKPSAVVVVGQLPRGTAGKIDRRAVTALPLPDHVGQTSSASASTELTAAQESLKLLWAETVPKEVFERQAVTGAMDFFHVGGNSLLLVDLQTRIRKSTGVFLDLVSMFGNSTLERMVALVQERREAIDQEPLDWDEETEPGFIVQPDTAPAGSKTSNLVVVLTGATGFLGRSLLRQLVANPNVQIIHCIAVRRLAVIHDTVTSDKVHVHTGDMSKPRLGLNTETAAHIFSTADTIIHNAANVSHLQHYRTLKADNVSSTQELARMASPRRIPFHYVSTAGVALYTGQDEFREVSGAAHPPPPDGADGYTASKWASERVLEKCSARFGLPLTIHRPSNINRDDVPDLDLFQNLLKYSRLLNAVPSSPNLGGFLNLVPVEDCAAQILGDALGAEQGGPRYFHCIGQTNLSFETLGDYINEGGAVDRLTLQEWTDRAEELGLHATIGSFLRSTERGEAIKYPLLVRD